MITVAYSRSIFCALELVAGLHLVQFLLLLLMLLYLLLLLVAPVPLLTMAPEEVMKRYFSALRLIQGGSTCSVCAAPEAVTAASTYRKREDPWRGESLGTLPA